MSGSAFPLDAEQIVRLTGAVLTRALNVLRHPDAKELRQDEITLALGQAAGVPLRVEGEGFRQRLLRYNESVRAEPNPSSPPLRAGGSDEA